jgi:hypothetical protein
MRSPSRIDQELAKAAGITRPYYKVDVLTADSVRFHLYGGGTVTYVRPGIGDREPVINPQIEHSLDTMRKAELLALANRKGITGRSRMTKAQLVAAITGAP